MPDEGFWLDRLFTRNKWRQFTMWNARTNKYRQVVNYTLYYSEIRTERRIDVSFDTGQGRRKLFLQFHCKFIQLNYKVLAKICTAAKCWRRQNSYVATCKQCQIVYSRVPTWDSDFAKRVQLDRVVQIGTADRARNIPYWIGQVTDVVSILTSSKK